RQHLEAALGSAASARIRRSILFPCRIRRLTPADFEALAVFIGHHLPAMSVGWLEAQLGGPWQRGDGGAFVALDRRHAIRAFGYFGRYSDEGVGIPGIWLRSIYTEPIARRLGLSRQLIEALLATASAQGLREVHSDVRRDNAGSLNLHRKLGFVEVTREELTACVPLLERARAAGRDLAVLRWRAAVGSRR